MSEETLKFRLQFALEMHSRQLHLLHIGYRRIKNTFIWYGWVKKLEQVLFSSYTRHQGTLETMKAIAMLFHWSSWLVFRCPRDAGCCKVCWMLLGAVSKWNYICTLPDERTPCWVPVLLSSTYSSPNSNFFTLVSTIRSETWQTFWWTLGQISHVFYHFVQS